MIKFTESAHWYDKDGKPQHDADLRVARKQKLFPSVTTVDKIHPNDFLNQWKMGELATAAFLNPPQPHENCDDYSNRIHEYSLNKSKIAAEFGTELHDVIEHYPQMPMNQDMMGWFNEYGKWHEKNVKETICSEITLVDNDVGVAGRTDRIVLLKTGELAVVDYKTQNVKADKKSGKKKPAFYDSHARQLAFYCVAYAKKAGIFPAIPRAINLIMDSNEVSAPYEKIWTHEEVKDAYQDFLLGTHMWMRKKKYWPVGEREIEFNLPLIGG